MKKNGLLILGIGVGVLVIGVILLLVLPGKKTYIVTFDSNGGSVVESQRVKEGENAKEPNTPTKEKYTFIEWTKDGGSFNFNTLIESDITLVASWKKTTLDEFEITIDPKNGDEVKQIKVLENQKLEKPEDPKYKGYVFKGWIIDGEEYDFDKEVTESFILVGSWEKEKEKYTVSFDSNGGSKVGEQKVVEGEHATKPENPTKEDNTFVEWQLNGKAYDFDSEVTSNIKLKAKWNAIKYDAYRSNSFYLKCYEKGTSNLVNIVKPGDKIECSIDFEVYAGDDISTIKYDLKYGEGLKLIETKNATNSKDKKSRYNVSNKKATSVGNAGKFIFEVLDKADASNSANYAIAINEVRFVTSGGKYYSDGSQQVNYMSIWQKMNSSHVYNNGGFTLNCTDKNNNVVEEVVNGDIIICEASIEVADGDEIKYLKYNVGGGSSLERINFEIDKSINELGFEKHYVASTPVKKLSLGKFTYKVINENNPYMLSVFIDGHFLTDDDRSLSPSSKRITYKNGNSTTKNEFKEIALNVISKTKLDIIAANKLEAGYYYVTSGQTYKSPLGGNVRYYTSSCNKVGSMLCKTSEDLICNRSSRTFIKITNNDEKYEYSVCLNAGYDYAYIYGTEKELMDKNDFSMITFPE